MGIPLTLSSVPAATPYVQYVATSNQTVFPYPFAITQDSDLVCVINGVTQPTDSGYTLSGQGNPTGGNLTFTLGQTAGTIVTLFRNIAIQRLTQIAQNSGFSSTAFNAEFNNIYLLLQQLAESLSFCLQVPNTNNPAPTTTLLPANYANKYQAYDSNGNPTPALLTSSGSLTQAIIAGLFQPQTAAEASAGITPSNFAYLPGDVRRYGATINGSTDDTTAYQASISVAKQSTSVEAYWPAGTAVVSGLTISAACKIRTAGSLTILQQKSGTTPGTGIVTITGSDVDLGTISAVGNISTDSGEAMHVIAIGGPCSRIRLGDIFGTNIRGDCLYIGGTAASPIYNVRAGRIAGSNTYRNRCSITGAEDVYIEAIDGTGGVGYRAFDMEPNSSSQAPTGIRVGAIRAGNCQFSGGNLTGGQGAISIDYADLDDNIQTNSSPGYPSFPSTSGNIGIIMGDTQSLHLGTLKARNYQERLFNSNANTIANVSVVVDNVDISNCNTTESTYKNLFNCDSHVTLELKNGTIALTALDRYITKGNANIVRLRNLAVSGGPIATFTTNGEFENLTINGSSLASTLFGNAISCIFKNITFTNASSATLLTNSTNNTIIHMSGTFSAVEGSGCSDNVAMRSTLNSIEYGPPSLLGGAIPSIAMGDANQVLTAAQAIGTSITTTGALTAQRNLQVPSTPRIYTVFNNCTGAGIQVIAASGSGTVIAVGKRAIVQFDGTNVVRITADT